MTIITTIAANNNRICRYYVCQPMFGGPPDCIRIDTFADYYIWRHNNPHIYKSSYELKFCSHLPELDEFRILIEDMNFRLPKITKVKKEN